MYYRKELKKLICEAAGGDRKVELNLNSKLTKNNNSIKLLIG
jgi:hypothetical protein